MITRKGTPLKDGQPKESDDLRNIVEPGILQDISNVQVRIWGCIFLSKFILLRYLPFRLMS